MSLTQLEKDRLATLKASVAVDQVNSGSGSYLTPEDKAELDALKAKELEGAKKTVRDEKKAKELAVEESAPVEVAEVIAYKK